VPLAIGDLDSYVCKENFEAVPAVTGDGGGAVGDLFASFEDSSGAPRRSGG
jgi:hypothetical protein